MPEPALTMDKIRELIQELDPNLDPDSEAFKVAAMLFAALEVGAWPHKVAAYTGYPPDLVDSVADRLIRAGVWREGNTYSAWLHPDGGGIEFWNDVNLGRGFVEVVNAAGTLSPTDQLTGRTYG